MFIFDLEEVLYDGIVQANPWIDYRWDTTLNTFVPTATVADVLGRFAVRKVGELWYNNWLGYLLDTTALSDNQIHTIEVKLYDSTGNIIPTTQNSASIFVDNIWPHACIFNFVICLIFITI